MNEDVSRVPIRTAPAQKPTPEKKPKISLHKILKKLRPIIWALVAVALAGLSYGYIHTKRQLNSTSHQSGQTTTQDLIEKVGKLVVLPANETPTTATVNDATKLKNQQFFSKTQNGDRVLIYSKSGQAVLYRPSVNKVVEYTQIDFSTGKSP